LKINILRPASLRSALNALREVIGEFFLFDGGSPSGGNIVGVANPEELSQVSIQAPKLFHSFLDHQQPILGSRIAVVLSGWLRATLSCSLVS
jgi:hypothetical protein